MAEPQQSKDVKQPQQSITDAGAVAVINLVNSSGFDSEASTIIVGKNVDAAIETDRGVLVQRREGRGLETSTERYLLPWANIKSVKYARQPAKA